MAHKLDRYKRQYMASAKISKRLVLQFYSLANKISLDLMMLFSLAWKKPSKKVWKKRLLSFILFFPLFPVWSEMDPWVAKLRLKWRLYDPNPNLASPQNLLRSIFNSHPENYFLCSIFRLREATSLEIGLFILLQFIFHKWGNFKLPKGICQYCF